MEKDFDSSPTESFPEEVTHAPGMPSGTNPAACIDNYEILRPLGAGGMGVVYLARQLKPIRRDVALKIIKPGMDSREVIARFQSERQALALMDHPHIARVFDAGTTDRGLPYFVMEWVDGLPITRYCDSKHLTVSQRIDLFIPVCKAIQHAHQKGIIHRDIKPSNVLVTHQDIEAVPKVIDFGLARALDAQITGETMMTSLGVVVGTLDYMSPEQAEPGRQDIDTRCDVYSLGAVLYEMVTGATPLDGVSIGKSYLEALQRVRDEQPKTPSVRLRQSSELKNAAALRQSDPEKLPKQVHKELDWIVMKALEKDRTRRYETVNGLARDLERYLSGEPVEAVPPSAVYRVQKFVRRYTAMTVATVCITVALATSSIVSWSFYRRATRERTRAEARFNDVRSLARFVLFDFDRVLALGPTPARKAVVEKATAYLDELAKDRINDPSLTRELVDGYLKIGDLQGNMYGPNLGDTAAAKASYERALAIADAASGLPMSAVAEVRVRVADLLMQVGLIKDAIPIYEKASQTLAETPPSDEGTQQALLNALSKLATAYSLSGNYSAAIQAYDQVVFRARELANTNPAQYRPLLAVGELRRGEIEARTGHIDVALPSMQHALALYEAIAAGADSSGPQQRGLSMASGVIGDILLLAGRNEEAVHYFQRALQVTEQLVAADPRNEMLRRDHAEFLARLGEALAATGDLPKACAVTSQARRAVREMIERSNPSDMDLHQYAWTLLTTPCANQRNPATARAVAKRLVASSKGENPAYLDLLARAYGAAGDFKLAIETEKQALILVPLGTSSDLRRELETNLAAFRKGVRYPLEVGR